MTPWRADRLGDTVGVEARLQDDSRPDRDRSVERARLAVGVIERQHPEHDVVDREPVDVSISPITIGEPSSDILLIFAEHIDR